MTPSLKNVASEFQRIANEKKINLEKIDDKWLQQVMYATQVCNFKNKEIFVHYVETALSNIPKQAIKN
jgi:hypothetical protein